MSLIQAGKDMHYDFTLSFIMFWLNIPGMKLCIPTSPTVYTVYTKVDCVEVDFWTHLCHAQILRQSLSDRQHVIELYLDSI